MPNILSDTEIDRIASKTAIQTVGKRILSALYSTIKRQMILLDGHKTKGAGKQTEPARRLRPFRHPCFFLILLGLPLFLKLYVPVYGKRTVGLGFHAVQQSCARCGTALWVVQRLLRPIRITIEIAHIKVLP